MKTVYSYHPQTGEFLGASIAHENQRRPGTYLLPAYSTEEKPPTAIAGKTRVFRDGEWSHVIDRRGVVYWLADGSRHEITELDVEPPADALSEAPPSPPVIPQSVTMRQARLALLQAELLQGVADVIDALPGEEGEAARIEWEYALTVERQSPLVQNLATALDLTEQQLDDLFTAAATL